MEEVDAESAVLARVGVAQTDVKLTTFTGPAARTDADESADLNLK